MPAPPSSPSDASPPPSSDDATASHLRRWGRRALWTLGSLIGTALLLAGVLLLALQTETGATAAAQFLARRVNPLLHTTLTVEQASGNWIRSLRLTNVSLTRTDSASGDTVTMAHVDTLSMQYRLGALLRGHVHLTALSLDAPSVTMRQDPDSTWDWVRLMPTADTSGTPTLSTQIDRLRLSDGQFAAHFYAGGRDSTARIRSLAVQARELSVGPAIGGHLDTLGLQAHLPADTSTLRLTARGSMSATHLRLDTLRLTSPRSRVRGHGTARLPSGPNDSLDDVSLTLRADPLVLGDLTPFLPPLEADPSEALTLEARLTGSERRLTLDAEARFSGGGTLTAHAEATPRIDADAGEAPLQYQVDAEIHRLTTSLIGPLDATENVLSASLTGSLRGRTLTTLDGTVEARLTDTRLYGLRTPELTLQSTVRDGTASVDLRGTLNGTSVSVQGTARPFDAAPSMDLTAQIRDFSLSAVDAPQRALGRSAPSAGLDGVLSGTVRIEGRSMTTASATYDLALTLGRSRIGTQSIEGGQLSLGVGPDRVTFDGTLTFPKGRMRAAGHATLDGTNRFVLETGRFENLDVAALLGDTTQSRVTGTLQAQGQFRALSDPKTVRGTATLTVQDGRYGPHRMTSMKTTARLDEGRLTTETSTTLNGGHWTFAVTSRPFASVPSAELTRGRFENVDIGPFLQDSTQSSALQGTIQGRVQGTSLATLQLKGRVTLDSSRVNRQKISSASLETTLREGTLRAGLTLEGPDEAVDLTMEARPFDDVPTYRITEGSFENLDLGALAGIPDLTTRLSGTLTLSGLGTTAPDLTLDSELTLRASTVNRANLSDGRLTLTADHGRVTTNGRFSVAGGSLQFSGQIDSLGHTPSYTFRTRARSIDVGALAGLDSLRARVEDARWRVDGRGTTLDSLTASTRFTADSLRVRRLQIDAMRLAGTLDRGLLTVDTLSVDSDAITGRGQGPLALLPGAGSSDFDLTATISTVAPLRPFVDAQSLQLRKALVDAHVYGAAEAQHFDGTVNVDGLIYEGIRLSDTRISFNGERGSAQLFDRLMVEGTAGYLSLLDVTATKAQFEATYDGTTVDLSSTVRLDQEHRADVAASFQPQTDPLTVRLHQINVRLGPDRWSLLQEATFTIGDTYRVDRLLLHSGTQQLAADGVLAPRGAQSLVVTLENVRLGGVAPLMGLSGLDGSMTGTLSVTGAATDPLLDGRLELDLRSGGSEVGTLRLNVGYEDFAVRFDARLTHTDGSVLTASGTVPADLRLHAPTSVNVSDRPVQLDASTERFPINWTDPFLDPATVQSVTGTLTGTVKVRGTLNQPELSGTASVSDVGAYLPTFQTRYRNGSATLQLEGNQMTLENAVVHSSNGGDAQANGVIDVPELTIGEYNLTVRADDFLAIDTRAYRKVVVDGRLSLRGTTRRPVLTGDVQVNRGSAYYSEILAETAGPTSEVSLSVQDQLILEERFGLQLTEADTTTFDLYDAAALDLTVQLQQNTWLRSTGTPEMNIQLAGELDVQKAPQQDLRLFGTIQVVERRSTIRQFNQEFKITEGTLTFNGDPYAPYFDLTAVYEQRARGTQGSEVRITLSLSGRPDNLSTSLSSDPPMNSQNILSYLATGRPANKLFSGGAESGNLATQMALGQASNLVENLAASELGLDVVRLQVRPEGVSYLTVGRYLTPQFFASIQQPLFTASSQTSSQIAGFVPDVTLEYQITDYLLLRSLSSQQSLQLNLLFEYAY